ncbi:MAG: hypothetical protein JW786_05015 [Desulfobacterales bacterium]|nr:hypothetical protein [Desulfobacterales bacterium]
MLIDWFTVIAQIINFLILVALLKYFLYGRILKAMEEREKKIALRLEEAEEQKKEATNAAESLRRKNLEIEAKSQKIFSQAVQEAEDRRNELIEAARTEAADLKSRWQDSIQREKEGFLRNLREMAGSQVYAIARRAFKDLADADLEDQVVTAFIKHIRQMPQDESQNIFTSFKNTVDDLVIRSAFEISPPKQKELTQTLSEIINEAIQIQYETAPELILGIELKTPGRKIAWSLEDYIRNLEEAAGQALESKGRIIDEKNASPIEMKTEKEGSEKDNDDGSA